MAPILWPFAVSTGPHIGLLVSTDDSELALDKRATANLARFKWLQRGNNLMAKYVMPAAEVHPASASFKFRHGRLGQNQFAADVPAAIAGRRGLRTTWSKRLPRLSPEKASEAMEVSFAPPRRIGCAMRKLGASASLRWSVAGRYLLTVATLDRRGSSSFLRGATQMAARVSWGDSLLGHGVPDSDIRFLDSKGEKRFLRWSVKFPVL